jgi:drug/metabolite transporter (DMT)-like permease
MSTTESRKLFARGEWLTLIGMVLIVFGAALVWKREMPTVAKGFEAVGAIFINPEGYRQSGYDLRMGWLPVGWTAVFCAVVCGALLLLEPRGREKRAFFLSQVILGIAVIVLAVLNIGPFPGSIMALIGGLLLLAGAIALYR